MAKDKEQHISISDIWPQERDYFSRPERYKYVRKIVEPTECVFCKSLEQGVTFDSLLLFEEGLSMVVLNKYPYNSGHILILPKRHCGDFLELSDDEFAGLSELLRKSVRVIRKVYDSSQGFNIGLNHGKVAGAGIPEHLHYHIVPRWMGDTNFFPLIAETKVLPETLEQSYEKMQLEFSKLKD